MVHSCSVRSCSNRSMRDKVSFYRFPLVRARHGIQKQADTSARLLKWLACINRSDLGLYPHKLKNARVCSDHFYSGKPSALSDMTSPDWVPQRNIGPSDSVFYRPLVPNEKIELDQEMKQYEAEEIRCSTNLQHGQTNDTVINHISVTSTNAPEIGSTSSNICIGQLPGNSSTGQSEQEVYSAPLFDSFQLRNEISDLREQQNSKSNSSSLLRSSFLPVKRYCLQPLLPKPASSNTSFTPELRTANLKPMCRLCMKTSSQRLVLIFGYVGTKQQESLVDQIEAVTGLQVVDGDGLPRQICRPCLKSILEWYSYKELCCSSDAKFRMLASAMQHAQPGQSFKLDSGTRAKQATTKKTSTITSAEMVSRDKSPNEVSVVVKEEVDDFSYRGLESEADEPTSGCEFTDAHKQQTLPFENVVVKLENEGFQEYATLDPLTNVDQESKDFEVPEIKIGASEIRDPYSWNDRLASEKPDNTCTVPESRSTFVSSSSSLVVTGFDPVSTNNGLIVTEVPGNIPKATQTVLSSDIPSRPHCIPNFFGFCDGKPRDDLLQFRKTSESVPTTVVGSLNVTEFESTKRASDVKRLKTS